MYMTNENPCPCCSNSDFELIFLFPSIPVSGIFRNNSSCDLKTNSLKFELCIKCAYVRQNNQELRKDYEKVTRSTELQYPKYINLLIQNLNTLKVNYDDLIIEIGANDGKYIQALGEYGYRNIIGIEPSEELASLARETNFKIYNNFFNLDFAKQFVSIHGKVKAVICRHTLEHIPNVADFIAGIHYCMLEKDAVLLIEVPDSDAILDYMNVYELWDEHLHYFSAPNLFLLLNKYNLKVLQLEIYNHLDTRNLLMWCTTGNNSVESIASNGNLAFKKVNFWRSLKISWNEFKNKIQAKIASSKKPIFMIGASHSQTNFINYLEISSSISYCIDDDPEKIGKIPPTTNNNLKIISTGDFMHSSNGALLKTGFGYPDWSKNISDYALKHDFSLIEPDFEKTK